mgnify:CR=1 FL=1
MEENMMKPAMPGEEMCPCDRETFERVWRRVMPDGTNSPIQTDPTADEQARTLMVRQQPESAVIQETGLALARREEVQPEQDVVCLGQGSEMYAALLREMIDGEMEDWRTYQALARRAGGSGTRVLSTMAADERRHAKRLSTAHFLITGERYQSPKQNGSRPAMDLMNGLREQFIHEQRGAAAYQGAAQETSDPCLRQLYQELAQEEAAHARMIRSLLEQM